MPPLKITKKNFDAAGAAKNLVRGYRLVPHIERFLPTWDEQGFEFKSEAKPIDDAWHPSGHCTPSLNDLYHHALEHPKERKLEPRSVKSFAVGHFWHQWLQWIVVEKLGFATWESVERRGTRWWGDSVPPADVENWPLNEHGGDFHKRMYRKEDLFYLQYPEQKDGRITDAMLKAWPQDELGIAIIRPKPWHWVTGSADIAPCTIPEHGEFVIDFKTMNSRDFAQDTPRSVKSWECQINVYMDFFDLERGIMVGIQKDWPHDLREYEFRRNQPLIDALYEKWELVAGCILDEEEPPKDLVFPLPTQGMSK